MQTKTSYCGQHFILSIVKNGKDTTLILSNTDETRNQVVFTDRYELMEIADFIHETVAEKKFAGLRNGKIVEFSNDRLDLNHDHIDQIFEIQLDKDQ
jgi:hypothetical protein